MTDHKDTKVEFIMRQVTESKEGCLHLTIEVILIIVIYGLILGGWHP